jgi:hypothetical protein
MVNSGLKNAAPSLNLKNKQSKSARRKHFAARGYFIRTDSYQNKAYGVIFISKNKAFFSTSRLESRSLFRTNGSNIIWTNGHNQQEQHVVQHEEDLRTGPYLEQTVLTSLEQTVMITKNKTLCSTRILENMCLIPKTTFESGTTEAGSTDPS